MRRGSQHTGTRVVLEGIEVVVIVVENVLHTAREKPVKG